jgi:hypothetical protein
MTTYGQTYLQIVNTVLARLRESSVATVSETTYSTFISKLVNQVKSEIEQAYYWNALRDTYAINTVDGTTSYIFTGAGPDAVVINGWDTTSPAPVNRGTNAQFDQWYFGVAPADIQSGPPRYFIPAGASADYDLKIDVYPKPDGVYALQFNIYKPQADLSAGTDVALVPQNVLIEEVISRAMIERGDDAAPKPQPGETFINQFLLSAAIAREAAHDDREMDWDAD